MLLLTKMCILWKSCGKYRPGFVTYSVLWDYKQSLPVYIGINVQSRDNSSLIEEDECVTIIVKIANRKIGMQDFERFLNQNQSSFHQLLTNVSFQLISIDSFDCECDIVHSICITNDLLSSFILSHPQISSMRCIPWVALVPSACVW